MPSTAPTSSAGRPLLTWPPRAADVEWRLCKVESEVALQVDAATAFAYATNPARWHEWHPATHGVEGVSDRPLRLGETVVEHIRTAGRRFSATWTVIAVDAPHLWVIATDTPQGLARISYRLADAAGGHAAAKTRFHRTLECRSKPWLLRQLDPLMIRWVLTPQSRRALNQLAQNLQTARDSP